MSAETLKRQAESMPTKLRAVYMRPMGWMGEGEGGAVLHFMGTVLMAYHWLSRDYEVDSTLG